MVMIMRVTNVLVTVVKMMMVDVQVMVSTDVLMTELLL